MQDLIQKLVQSDRQAWNTFVDATYSIIEWTINHQLPESMREDAIQHVYENLIKNDYRLLRKFRGTTMVSLLAYVKQIARYVALNDLKKSDLQNSTQLLEEIIDARTPQNGTMNDESPEYLYRQLIEAADQLDIKYREVMLLRIANYSHKEISRILNIPLNTVLTRMQRAKDQMRSILQNQFQLN